MKNSNKSSSKNKTESKPEKNTKQKSEKISDPYQTGHFRRKKTILYVFSIFLIAIGLGCLHIYHVSTMFENDRHFSHLSNLEREMTFRTEMGLYYSYYKRIVQSRTFGEGFFQIINDNLTEYPNVINTLQRFNLYPEITIGFCYKHFMSLSKLLGLSVKECWQVERGHGLDPVESCEGLGDETYFYLEAIWMCSGITVALLFIYAIFLSGSIAGGILSIICFFYNHGECTRVQWTPPLRESFAFPFLILQMLCISVFLRQSHYKKSKYPIQIQVVCISLASSLCLCLWQFSQFVLLTQALSLYLMYIIGSIDKNTILSLTYGLGLGLLQAFICLFGNQFLLCSILTCILASMLFSILILEPLFAKLEFLPEISRLICAPIAAFISILFKFAFNIILQNEDDGHILNILKSKLTSYKDFHTLLYTCTAEFDFLPLDTVFKLCESLLIPSVLIVLILLIYFCLKSKNKRNAFYNISPEIIYNIIQMFAFIVMAIFIMRLKLFMTPHLCLVVSLLASKKYVSLFESQDIHWATLALLISGMSVRGIKNLHQQRSILGEYSNVPMEELFSWISSDTDPKAVFAGPMSLTANLLLSTNRPIVNHPHYENAAIRERTKKVYSIFSRKSHLEVYNILKELKVDYVVIDHAWCFGESQKGCSMLDLWDIEEPHMKGHPALCPELFNKAYMEPFQRVFHNDAYTVLRLGAETIQFRHIERLKL